MANAEPVMPSAQGPIARQTMRRLVLDASTP
jgi:hypothetical protein